MKMDFKFNKRELERAVAKEVDRVAREYQDAVQSLALELKGRPVEEIKPLVSARWRDLGGEITDPELTEVATAIAEGVKINSIRG